MHQSKHPPIERAAPATTPLQPLYTEAHPQPPWQLTQGFMVGKPCLNAPPPRLPTKLTPLPPEGCHRGHAYSRPLLSSGSSLFNPPQTCSRKNSSPYDSPASPTLACTLQHIQTGLNISPLLSDSISCEDSCLEQGGDDCEGTSLSSRPPSLCSGAMWVSPTADPPANWRPEIGVEKARSKIAVARRKRKSQVANVRAAVLEHDHHPGSH